MYALNKATKHCSACAGLSIDQLHSNGTGIELEEGGRASNHLCDVLHPSINNHCITEINVQKSTFAFDEIQLVQW